MSARRDQGELFERELACWPGVVAERSRRAKHQQVRFTVGERSRFVVYPTTPGDRRAIHNHIARVRRILRELGATRQEASVCR